MNAFQSKGERQQPEAVSPEPRRQRGRQNGQASKASPEAAACIRHAVKAGQAASDQNPPAAGRCGTEPAPAPAASVSQPGHSPMPPGLPIGQPAALSAEEEKEQMIRSHLDAWAMWRRTLTASIDDFEALKCCKIFAEALAIGMKSERRARGLDAKPAENTSQTYRICWAGDIRGDGRS